MGNIEQDSTQSPKNNPFTKATTLSKLSILALFVILPFIGFYSGITYQKAIDSKRSDTNAITCTAQQKSNQEVSQMALRPSDASPNYNPITGWKIYQNSKYNFEFDYPDDFYVAQETVSGEEDNTRTMFYMDVSKYKPSETPPMEFSGIRIIVRNFTEDLYKYVQEAAKTEFIEYDPDNPPTIEKTEIDGTPTYRVFDTYYVSKGGKLYSINNGIDDNLFKQILSTFRFIQ